MKKTMLIGAFCAMTAALPTMSSAATNGLYGSLHLEGVFVDDDSLTSSGVTLANDFDTGIGIGGAIGYNIAPYNVRIEAELTYRDNDVTISTANGVNIGTHLDAVTYMTNVYYDIPTKSRITPYVGTGIGIIDFDTDDTAFAYQIMTGGTLSLKDRHDIYAGYRYLGTSGYDLGIPNTTRLDYDAHIIEAGYRFYF